MSTTSFDKNIISIVLPSDDTKTNNRYTSWKGVKKYSAKKVVSKVVMIYRSFIWRTV